MVVGISSFREALKKLGLGGGAPEEAPADLTKESAAEEPTQVSGDDVNPWGESPASADRGMPLPDDGATKTASAKGLKESWGGAYRNSMTGGRSKTEALSQGGSSPSDSRPVSGPQEIPVEDLSIGVFNALSDGIDAVVKTTSSAGSLVATEARHRVKAIRFETASEFGVLREFVTKLVCGTKGDRRKE